MGNIDKKTPDGLINPEALNGSRSRINQIKEIRLGVDGLMERTESKVVTNDGRELLRENENPEEGKMIL